MREMMSCSLMVVLLLCCQGRLAQTASGGGGGYAHDVTTKSGLTSMYNENIVKAEHMQRPLNSGGSGSGPSLLGKLGYKHEGVRYTTAEGNQYLVHKGGDYGISSDTVVVRAEHMSSKWTRKGGSVTVTNGMTIGDAVKAGGEDYTLGKDDCRHAAGRMMRKAGN